MASEISPKGSVRPAGPGSGIAPTTAASIAPGAGNVAQGTIVTGTGRTFLATSQTSTSATYEALATSVTTTVTIGPSGRAQVSITARMSNSGANSTFLAFSATGITAGANEWYMEWVGTTAFKGESTFTVTGLTPGSVTFTVQVKVGAGTGTYSDVAIAVLPL